jgi:hypothetical protein
MKAKLLVVALAALLAPFGALAAGQPRTIEIAVTEKGFEPSHVTVAAGQPLKLVVTRRTDATCAKEIVIPDAHLEARLPLGTPVTLTFTPKNAGTIRYACGMYMITGILEVASAQDGSSERGAGNGMMGGMMDGGGEGMMGGMMGGSMQDMSAIHGLLSQHEKVRRSVKDLPDGVETVTTSDDPAIAKLIREHVWQMKSRVEEGRPIRQMDPVFREIFAHHAHIHMKIEDVPGGVRVTETADEPHVVPLVRQHARRAVSEFVAEGMPRAMRPTPLPPDYKPARGDDAPQPRQHRCGCMT